MPDLQSPARSASSAAMPAPISCYIRAKNEERKIADVIRAVAPAVDEVVLIDSGSADNTVALAEAAGARVVRQDWLGYGAQKRFAEDQCKHDWLLSIDADEVISPEFADELRALFAKGEPQASVFQVTIINAPAVGKPWRGFNQLYRNRLYDRRKIRTPDHAAWDQLDIPAGMRIGKLHAPILHYSIADLGHLETKFNTISGVHASEGKLKPFVEVAFRMLFAEGFYFFKHYILRGLWRAGWYGFAVAKIAAHGRWLKDAKMVEIHLLRREADRRKH